MLDSMARVNVRWDLRVLNVVTSCASSSKKNFLKESFKAISNGALNCLTRPNVRHLLPYQIIVNKIGQSWPLAYACALAPVIGSNLYKK